MTLEQLLEMDEAEQKKYLLDNIKSVSGCSLDLNNLAIDSKTISVTRGPKKHKKTTNFWNVPASFDIETTSFTSSEGIETAVMYVWQFMIGHVIIMGRTWTEFFKLCELLVEIFELESGKQHLVVYVHNLAFEFQHMRKYFEGWSIFARKEREPMKAETMGIEFRDSLALSGCSLANLSSQLDHNIHKMEGDLDYDLVRHYKTKLTKTETLYCIYDVFTVVTYISEKIEKDGDITKIPLTKTGYVRKHCREKTIYDKRKGRGYFRNIHNMVIDVDEYSALREAFQGGFTHSNPYNTDKVIENVKHIDFTSSYPTVMISEEYPATTGVHAVKIYTLKDLNKIKNYLYICHIKIDKISSLFDGDYYISCSKCKNAEKMTNINGRLQSADHIEMWVTNVDLEIIQKTYVWQSFECDELYAYKKRYLPAPLVECIVELYEAKTIFKDVEGKELEYSLAKQLLNSIYGVMVQKIDNPDIVYDGEAWDTNDADLEAELETYNESQNRFNVYTWGVFVTAYARRNLWLGIMAAGEENYIYADTDSIFYKEDEEFEEWVEKYNRDIIFKLKKALKHHRIDPGRIEPAKPSGEIAPMGVWDREKSPEKFKTLGAKRYIELFEDGSYKTTIAGLSKTDGRDYIAKQKDPFEFFAEGMKIPAETTGKLTHKYCDKNVTEVLRDYCGEYAEVETRSGINLSKCEFSMSMAEDFISAIIESQNRTYYI